METYTVDRIMAWRPCPDYPRERVEALFGRRDSLTLRDILALDIPAEDRVWVATRPGALPDAARNAWLERIVTRAITTHALHCGVPKIETWAQRWLGGEDRSAESASLAASFAEELSRAATDAAVRSATDAAARVARAATEVAEVSEAAAWAAVASPGVAQATERDAQIADLLAVLGGER